MRRALPLFAANAAVLTAAVLVSATGGPVSATLARPGVSLSPTADPSPAAAALGPRASPSPPPAPSPSPLPRRSVLETTWQPYAVAGPVVLHLPGDRIEVVGLHESGHDGAQPQSPVLTERIGLLGSRARDTDGQGAADIVVDPTRPVRAPVTGTVLRAGTYTLYCDHVDQYLVVEPDARPGWEVKLLHFEGLRVAEGDRVQAGVTVVGSRARVLPFASQVDKHTVAPHWPHLHVEVVDPSVPDRPSGRTCD